MLRFYFNRFEIVYFDDILIYSKNDEKHMKHVRLVIKALHRDEYYAKSSKCAFFQKHIKFCDYIINNKKIQMNQTKFKTIKN